MSDADRHLRRYRVTRRYRAGAWQLEEGAEVELLGPDARWINRDSPGVLEPSEPRRIHASATTSWTVEAVED